MFISWVPGTLEPWEAGTQQFRPDSWWLSRSPGGRCSGSWGQRVKNRGWEHDSEAAKHGDSLAYLKMSQPVAEQSQKCPLHLGASTVVLE